MSWRLFLRTWRAQRIKLALVAVALVIWGSLMPVIYEAFKEQIQILLGTGAIPQQFAQFGGGDLFTPARHDRRSGSSIRSLSPSGSSSRLGSR